MSPSTNPSLQLPRQVGYWSNYWYHTFNCWLGPLRKSGATSSNVQEAYDAIMVPFAELDALADPRTGAKTPLDPVDISAGESEEEINLRESHRQIVLTAVGCQLYAINQQLAAPDVKGNADFQSWIARAVGAMKEAFVLLRKDLVDEAEDPNALDVGNVRNVTEQLPYERKGPRLLRRLAPPKQGDGASDAEQVQQHEGDEVWEEFEEQEEEEEHMQEET